MVVYDFVASPTKQGCGSHNEEPKLKGMKEEDHESAQMSSL